MTVALVKTKAEQALAADFAARAGELPGNTAVASSRASAMADFAASGLPHRRIEAWKYTDLRANLKDLAPIATRDDTAVSLVQLNEALGPLAVLDADRVVFVNGSHRLDLSVATSEAKVSTLAAAFAAGKAPAPVALAKNEAIVSLNAALATDGALVIVDRPITRPLLVVVASAGPRAQLSTLRHSVTLAPGASATLIEAHVALSGAAASRSNSLLEINSADASNLTHIFVGLEGANATHLETISATLGADTTLRSFQLTAGTSLARTQSFVKFAGENAKLDISGLMLGRGRDHIDTTLVIDHAVPGCESRELFKAVLDDSARAVFQGKVIVRPDAQKTDGKQMAKALMLSESCEFDSKPELEIYADDVVCGHGATVAEIDPSMMFYLRSRGIPKDEARAMLIESFVGEALEKIDDETLRETLTTITRQWLAAGQV